MSDSRAGASQQGVREITLKQIQEQKTFVREYCRQFFMPQQKQTEEDELRQGTDTQYLDLQNNGVTTSRSGAQHQTGPHQNTTGGGSGLAGQSQSEKNE